jgi:hypothetical protein
MTRPRSKNRTSVEALQIQKATLLVSKAKLLSRAKRMGEKALGIEPQIKKFAEIQKTVLPQVLSELFPDGRIDMKLRNVLSLLQTHPDLTRIRQTDLQQVLETYYLKNSVAGWEEKVIRAKTIPTLTLTVKKVKAIAEHNYGKDAIYPDYLQCHIFNRSLGKDMNKGDQREKCFTVIGYPTEQAIPMVGGRYGYEYNGYKVIFNDQHKFVDLQMVR